MPGRNSLIVRNGLTLQVQTEVAGGRPSEIETRVYHTGRLVYSRRVPRPKPSGPHAEGRMIKALDDEHRAVLDDLASGRLDHHLPGPRT